MPLNSNVTGSMRLGQAWHCAKLAHPGISDSDIARFEAKVRRSTHGCWEWAGRRAGGGPHYLYGYFTIGGRSVPAHRLSWAMANGPIPAGLSVLHHCDNGICVRPDHLFIGTQADNMRDAASKGRLHVSRPRRHKVTDVELAEIRAKAALGRHGIQRTLAREYGVTEQWISLVLQGKRRQHGPPRPRPESAHV